MKLEGDYHFNVERQRLFDSILDPEVLARTMPGCEKLELVEEGKYKGVLNLAIGPVKGKFQGTLELSDVRPPDGYHMKIKGQGPSGFMKGEGALILTDAEEGGTNLRYELDAQVGGRMAAVGQRLMDSSAKVITQQGLEALAAQVGAPAAAAAEGEAAETAPPAPPSQAKLAARFAGGLWKEMVPAPARRVLAILGWVALGAVLGWWLRGC